MVGNGLSLRSHLTEMSGKSLYKSLCMVDWIVQKAYLDGKRRDSDPASSFFTKSVQSRYFMFQSLAVDLVPAFKVTKPGNRLVGSKHQVLDGRH